MSDNLVVLLIGSLRRTVAGMCVAGALWLMSKGRGGLGWLLFIAVLLGSITVRSHE